MNIFPSVVSSKMDFQSLWNFCPSPSNICLRVIRVLPKSLFKATVTLPVVSNNWIIFRDVGRFTVITKEEIPNDNTTCLQPCKPQHFQFNSLAYYEYWVRKAETWGTDAALQFGVMHVLMLRVLLLIIVIKVLLSGCVALASPQWRKQTRGWKCPGLVA